MKRRLRTDSPQSNTGTPNKSQTTLKKKQFAKADVAKRSAKTLIATPSKPKPPTAEKARVAKIKTINKLNVGQLDALGLRLAGLPIAGKDKDIVAAMLIDELGVKDAHRFSLHVHEENVPTAKT